MCSRFVDRPDLPFQTGQQGSLLKTMSDPNTKQNCYRYVTAAVHGPCRKSQNDALLDALRAGLAYKEAGAIKLLGFARMEQVPSHLCASCG